MEQVEDDYNLNIKTTLLEAHEHRTLVLENMLEKG